MVEHNWSVMLLSNERFVCTAGQGGEDRGVLDASDNKLKCILPLCSWKKALSHPHRRVWVPPMAANWKHCVSQQAPTQACFMPHILWQWRPNLMSYFGTSNRWQCVCSPFRASCSHVTSRENRMWLFISFLRLICLGESVPFLAQLK